MQNPRSKTHQDIVDSDSANGRSWQKAANNARVHFDPKTKRTFLKNSTLSAFDSMQSLDAKNVRRAFEAARNRRRQIPRSKERAKTGPGFLPSFVAIDFETANTSRASACAVALVRVDVIRGVAKITRRAHTLLKPSPQFFDPRFVRIHGIQKSDVSNAPFFWQVLPRIMQFLDGAQMLVAHNAGFDRSVLRACCEHTGQLAPEMPFLCTVKLARRVYGHGNAGLAQVCQALDIPLQHHDASSDASASAQVLLALAHQREDFVKEAIEDVQRVKEPVFSRR